MQLKKHSPLDTNGSLTVANLLANLQHIQRCATYAFESYLALDKLTGTRPV